jgi:hypothetical protein
MAINIRLVARADTSVVIPCIRAQLSGKKLNESAAFAPLMAQAIERD